MEFIVTIRMGGEPLKGRKKVPEMQWAPMVVEAEDRWDALVQAVERLGLEDKVPMRYFWKKASIKKRESKDIRRFRVKEALVKEVEAQESKGESNGIQS